MRVGLIGPYPPPRGGISVHLKRLEEALQDQGISVTIFNSSFGGNDFSKLITKLSKLKWFLNFLTCARVDILHIHVSTWRDRAIIILLARIRRLKTVMTVHSLRDNLDTTSRLPALYISFSLKHAGYIIVTGENEKDKLLKRFNCATRLSVLHAFIPPRWVEIELPNQVTEFIGNQAFIIAANGSNTDFYQGQDIYGLDMLVELCGRLTAQMKVGFIYCLTSVTDQVYLAKVRERIKELRLEDSFLIVLENLEFWPILEKSHLFLRPTCTDSYGVSIAEALTLRIPSVASDVCKRPEGTVLFGNRDSGDLYAKVWGVIQNYERSKAIIQNLQIEDCTSEILRIYQHLVETD